MQAAAGKPHKRSQNAQHGQQAGPPAQTGKEFEGVRVFPQCAVQQHAPHISQIAAGISHVHQESDIAAFASHGQQSFEDRGVYGHVRQVQAQADQHHETEGRNTVRAGHQGREDHHEAREAGGEGDPEGEHVAANEDQTAIGQHDTEGHPEFRGGELCRSGVLPESFPELGGEVCTDTADDGDQQVHEDDCGQSWPESPHHRPAIVASHAGTFSAGCNVALRRGGRARQHSDGKGQRQQKQGTGGRRHPVFGNALLQQPGTGGFGESVGHDEAGAEPGQQGFRDATALQEAHHQSEHHAERQPVEEHGEDVPRSGQQSEQDQCQFTAADQQQQGAGATGRRHPRNDSDADEFGQAVTDDLGGNDEEFEVQPEVFGAFEFGGSEGLAEGVGAEVGAERGEGCPECPACRKLAGLGGRYSVAADI